MESVVNERVFLSFSVIDWLIDWLIACVCVNVRNNRVRLTLYSEVIQLISNPFLVSLDVKAGWSGLPQAKFVPFPSVWRRRWHGTRAGRTMATLLPLHSMSWPPSTWTHQRYTGVAYCDKIVASTSCCFVGCLAHWGCSDRICGWIYGWILRCF